MSDKNHLRGEDARSHAVSNEKELANAANELCEKALEDARIQLHPLLRQTGLDRLSQRAEFLESFKSALERRIARTLAMWLPGVQAIFKYDEMYIQNVESWDGSIHLLVKVPLLSDRVRALGRKLDGSLVKYFHQRVWERFRMRQSILEVHQVTPNELRHGIGYGAMFSAVYTAPVKVWPQDR